MFLDVLWRQIPRAALVTHFAYHFRRVLCAALRTARSGTLVGRTGALSTGLIIAVDTWLPSPSSRSSCLSNVAQGAICYPVIPSRQGRFAMFQGDTVAPAAQAHPLVDSADLCVRRLLCWPSKPSQAFNTG